MRNAFCSRILKFVFFSFLLVSSISCLNKKQVDRGIEREEEFENPGAAAEWEFNMLKDKDGRIPEGIKEKELAQARAIYARQSRLRLTTSNIYTRLGPVNFAGRSRCVEYDVRYDGVSNNIVLASGVSGGIYKSTDGGATWTRKSSTTALYSVTSLVQDPRPGHQDTWYYSTGEAIGTNVNKMAPPYSDGVFKSIDNGETWAKLAASNPGIYEKYDRPEDLIWRVAVNPVNGDVYMAAVSSVFRSEDGGSTWECVVGSTNPGINTVKATDVAITSSGRIYAAFSGYCSSEYDGVWTSSSGSAGSWSRIAGEGAGDSPAGWYEENNYGRIVLATAPSDNNVLFAYIDTYMNLCPGLSTTRLFRWNNDVATWTDLSSNLPGCAASSGSLLTQGGYDMTLHIKPDDANVIFIGGTDMFCSTDGFTTSNKLSYVGGYANNLHPDMHWISFQPGNSKVMLVANDGGVYKTDDNLSTSISWNMLNNGLTTLQYYHVSVDPVKGSDKIMGGTQDNGTLRRVGSSLYYELAQGGDGMISGISNQINGKFYEYASRQYGYVQRHEVGGTDFFYTQDITPNSSVPGSNNFYTVFKLDDDNTEIIYYRRENYLARNNSASTATPSNWTVMNGVTPFGGGSMEISALATTRGNYDPLKSSLFIGYSIGGKVLRLDNPANTDASASPVDISSPSFSPNGFVSSISVNPRNDDTVMVTFSNYNTISVWWTGNANAASPTWTNVERNLTLPSVRSSAIAVSSEGVEYFVGTSVGLFHSTNPLSEDWTQESPDGLGNSVVTSLALRASDNHLIIGTFGNSIWGTTLSTASPLPVTLIKFTGVLQNGKTELNWSTSAEYNSAGFEIQRSRNGNNFIPLGFIASNNSSNIQAYHFTDNAPLPLNYYRLKMVDKNSYYKFSEVVVVQTKNQTQNVYAVSPFKDAVEIRFAKIPTGHVEICMFDVSGKLVGSTVVSGSSRYIMNFNNRVGQLPNGVYLLEVKTGEQKFKLKVIKQW